MNRVGKAVEDGLGAGLGMDWIEEAGECAPTDLPVGGHGDFVDTVRALDVVVRRVESDAAALGDEGELGRAGSVEAGAAAVELEFELEAGRCSVSNL